MLASQPQVQLKRTGFQLAVLQEPLLGPLLVARAQLVQQMRTCLQPPVLLVQMLVALLLLPC